jgi:DNA-binding transcriptional LysR family regulator
MNLKHFEHLLALAETASFSRAAERAHVTQPALSRSIQSLEEELGGQLFDRVGKRNHLTPLGAAVVERARRVILETSELKRSAELLRGGGGAIRVGLGSGAGALLMTPLLKHAAANHPSIRVAITRGSTELQLGQLRAQELDALIVDVRRIAPAPDLLIEGLVELRTAFVCRAGHPLAARRRVEFGALLDYPVASTPLSDEIARLLVARYGVRADPTRMVSLHCEDVKSLIDTVADTDAIFLGVVAAAREGIAKREMVELPVSPALNAGARFAYVTLAGRTEAPVMAVLRRFVAEKLRD